MQVLRSVRAKSLALVLCGGAVLWTCFAGAQDDAKKPVVDFVKDVKPILEAKCLGCHSTEKHKSDFVIQDSDSMMKGGKISADTTRSIINKDKPADSLLLVFIKADKANKGKRISPMPPLPVRKKGKGLSADEIATIGSWVAAGANWPKGVTLSAE